MKYKRPSSTKKELLRTVRKLFKQNLMLKRKLKVWREFKKLMSTDWDHRSAAEAELTEDW